MSASVQRHGVDPKDVPRPASEACHLAAAAGAPRASCSGPIGARGVLPYKKRIATVAVELRAEALALSGK
jgi:hypothetical protein